MNQEKVTHWLEQARKDTEAGMPNAGVVALEIALNYLAKDFYALFPPETPPETQQEKNARAIAGMAGM